MKEAVVLAALLLATHVAGCGTVKTALVEPRASQVVDETLRALTREENLERLRALTEIQDLESVSRGIVEAGAEGALVVLSREENQRRLVATVENLADALLGALARGVEQSLGPAIERQGRKILDASLETILSKQVRADLAALVEDVARSFSRSMTMELERAVKERLGPAVGDSLEGDVLPALGRALKENIHPVISQVSRDVAREAALGLNEALAGPLGDTIQARVDGFLTSVKAEGKETAGGLVGYLAVTVGILILGLVALAYFLRVYVRVLRGRERALELVTSSIKEFEGGNASLLAKKVKSNGEGTLGGDSLREFLDSKQHLKVHGP